MDEEMKALNNLVKLVVDTMKQLQRVEIEKPNNRDIIGHLNAWSNERPSTKLNDHAYHSLNAIAATLCATIDIQPQLILIGFLRTSFTCRNDFKNWSELRDMVYDKICSIDGEEEGQKRMRGLL